MVSKNNRLKKFEQTANRQQHFGIRKLTVGAASVLLGTSLYLGTNSQAAKAATVDNNSDNDKQETASESDTGTTTKQVVVEKKAETLQTADQAQNNDASTDEQAQKQETSAAVANSQAVISAAQKSADQATQSASAETLKVQPAAKQEAKKATSEKTDIAANKEANKLQTFALRSAAPIAPKALSESKVEATAATTDEKKNAETNDYKTVTTASEFQQAASGGWFGSSDKGVNVSGNINITSDINIAKDFVIHGLDGATLTFSNDSALKNSANLTLDNITINGSVMGSGNVTIKGNVTSNVNDINGKKLDNDEFKRENGNGNRNNWRAANFATNNVTIADGASLTINRSSIGDGINLPNGSTVNVSDNAKLTINMNLNNGSETERYHNAGVFMYSGGNFITGENSVVTMNTSIGQAIAIGAGRPYTTDKDRFGGYGKRSREAGPTLVQTGTNSTFDFAGRDGVVLGNNANFNVGKYAKVHFENKGRGVALDLANQSNINIGQHADTLFHSVGKAATSGPSGSYDGYNYVGVNEGGNITIDEYATFRVILEGRGDNAWDDVVSLDSQSANTHAAFTSKKGAIVDIRDDNTNFYAELISFPLGNSYSRIDIQDPLYLNLQRYSSGGATTGWMPVGGTDIQDTSQKYTANLIYMSSNKGIFSVNGTDYVVYQQIKSDGAQQIWLNVNGVDIPMSGFQTKDIWNNNANPDLSISGMGLTGGIRANQVHNTNGSPLTGKDAPYYGISTQRADHQIWFPHETSRVIPVEQENVITYVYEDGSPVLDANGKPVVSTQKIKGEADLTLSLSQDTIKDIQNYAQSHNADEVLKYITEHYTVTKTSWKITDAVNTSKDDPYSAITSPVKDGYTTEVQSTNAPGVVVGADGKVVKANFEVPIKELLNSDGTINDKVKGDGVVQLDNYKTVVVYKKDAVEVTGTVTYIDDTTKTVLQTADLKGTVGEKIDYNTTSTIDNYEKQGYKLVSSNFENGKEIFKDKGNNFEVHLAHDIVPVGPNNPVDGIAPSDYTKDVKETVHYVGAGDKTPKDVVQTSQWSRTLTYDKVTKKLVPNGEFDTDWTITPGQKTEYDQVNTPVVEGYYADKASVPATAVTQEDIEKVVVYKEVGKIVPVTPDGKEIPDVPQPPYKNDPNDPTKVVPNEPVPNIPGYTPEVPSVTPNDPGKDTPVIYTPDVKDQTAVVIYQDINDPAKPVELAKSDTMTGKVGSKIDYSTADEIKQLEDKGYVLVNNGFPADATYTDKSQTFYVTFVHGTVPVTPDKPGKPGEPINPNDPEGPKYPGDTAENDLTKTITRTIEYTGAGDKTPKSVTQDVTFTANGVLDKVTGKWITPLTWSKDQSVPEVVSPTIPGYHVTSVSKDADGNNVAGVTLSHDDNSYKVVVTYAPDGTEIRNQKENKASQVVKYVDEQGNELAPSKNASFDFTYSGDTYNKTTGALIKEGSWNATSHNFDAQGVPVIDGYVAVTGYTKNADGSYSAGGFTATNDGSESQNNRVFEVVYKKIGNIVPQDPNGNPIPDPENPSTNVPDKPYVNDPNDPTKVVPNEPVPNIPGYTPNIPSVTPDDPTKDTPVVYTPDAQDQKAQVIYQDVNDPAKPVELATSGILAGKAGSKINYSTADEIKQLEDKGYVLVNNGFPTDAAFDSDDNTTQTFYVTFKHGTVPVNPENPGKPNQPINPNDPEGPKYPGDTAENDLTKTITRTIEYTGAGDKTPKSVTQDVTFTANGVLDKVTGKWITPLTWSKDQSVPEVVSPTIEGYHVASVSKDADGNNVASVTLNHDDNSYKVIVTYAKDGEDIKNAKNIPSTQTVKFVDENGNELAPSDKQSFDFTYSGDKYNSTTGALISNGKWNATSHKYGTVNVPVIDGYVAVTGYTKNADGKIVAGGLTATTDDPNVEAVVVYHKVGKIVPEDPGHNPIPDVPQPPYKNDPDDPTKVVPNEPVPEIPGYVPSTPTVTPDDPTKDTPVPYTPEEVKKGEIIVNVYDKTTGEFLPGYETKSGEEKVGTDFKYDKETTIKSLEDKGYVVENPDIVIPTEITQGSHTYTINVVHGTVPVNPENPGKPDQPINPNDPEGPKYPGDTAENDLTKTVTRTINYVGAGDKTPKSVTQEVKFTADGVLDKVTGKWITPLTWSKDQTVGEVVSPTIPGYHVTSVSKDADGNNVGSVTISHNDSSYDVTVTYAKDGEDIKNKQDIPSTQTVKFVDENGNEIAKSDVQDFEFTYSGDKYNATTGDLISKGEWNATSHKYGTVNVPVIDGYVAVTGYTKNADGKIVAGGLTATTDDPNVEAVVVYHKVGKIVPEDPGHNPIPDVPQPPYKNDPDDPTKVVPNEPVPDIPGYTPNVPSVTPEDPTKDTPVPYTPDVKDQTAVVIYQDVNDPDHPVQIATSGTLTGKIGSRIDYSTAKEIRDLENKGYVLVKDGFPTDATYAKDAQTFYVTFKHGTIPVTPENPGKPDQPINPNDPEGPKYPDETAEKNLVKTGTQTVHYEGAGEYTPKDSVTTIKFDRDMIVDKVTGKVISVGNWTPSTQTYDKITSPNIPGYTPSEKVVGGDTIKSSDDNLNRTYTVTYVKDGEEIKNKQDIPSTQTVKFVDSEGNEIAKSDVQDFEFTYSGDKYNSTTGDLISKGEWNATSHKYGTVNVPVIDGYVAVSGYTKTSDGKIVAGGLTATTDDPNVEAVIVYKKIGNIVPQTPDHKPVPDPTDPNKNVPNKPFENDPNDPTKVVPNEPVPDIPGYTPNIPSVTPDDPTKDVPVIYTPDAKKQTAVVIYQDINDPKHVIEIATSGTLTGEVGSKIDYSTADEIKKLEDKGYVLVKNGFPTDAKYTDQAQTFYVTFKHGTVPVTPDKPGKPGEPINPNDPNGPKYPDETAEKNLVKTGTQTVHYQGAGANTPKDSVTTIKFDRDMVVDKVTGKVISVGNWTPSTQTYDKIISPTIVGYTPSETVVGGDTIKSSDDNINRTYTVTYTPDSVPVIPDNPEPTPEPEPTPQPHPQPEPTPDVPDTPDEPDVPQPHPQTIPDEPEDNTPDQPETPAPHPTTTPDVEESTPTPVVDQKQPAEVVAPKEELPQTGSHDDAKAAIAGASIALIGLAGLAGAKKRRKD